MIYVTEKNTNKSVVDRSLISYNNRLKARIDGLDIDLTDLKNLLYSEYDDLRNMLSELQIYNREAYETSITVQQRFHDAGITKWDDSFGKIKKALDDAEEDLVTSLEELEHETECLTSCQTCDTVQTTTCNYNATCTQCNTGQGSSDTSCHQGCEILDKDSCESCFSTEYEYDYSGLKCRLGCQEPSYTSSCSNCYDTCDSSQCNSNQLSCDYTAGCNNCQDNYTCTKCNNTETEDCSGYTPPCGASQLTTCDSTWGNAPCDEEPCEYSVCDYSSCGTKQTCTLLYGGTCRGGYDSGGCDSYWSIEKPYSDSCFSGYVGCTATVAGDGNEECGSTFKGSCDNFQQTNCGNTYGNDGTNTHCYSTYSNCESNYDSSCTSGDCVTSYSSCSTGYTQNACPSNYNKTCSNNQSEYCVGYSRDCSNNYTNCVSTYNYDCAQTCNQAAACSGKYDNCSGSGNTPGCVGSYSYTGCSNNYNNCSGTACGSCYSTTQSCTDCYGSAYGCSSCYSVAQCTKCVSEQICGSSQAEYTCRGCVTGEAGREETSCTGCFGGCDRGFTTESCSTVYSSCSSSFTSCANPGSCGSDFASSMGIDCSACFATCDSCNTCQGCNSGCNTSCQSSCQSGQGCSSCQSSCQSGQSCSQSGCSNCGTCQAASQEGCGSCFLYTACPSFCGAGQGS